MAFCAEWIREQLNMPEMPVYVFETLDSTSNECRRRMAAGEWQCLVLAANQTEGKGRCGKSFFSPAGGLYMSLAMHLQIDGGSLTCRAAVETAEAIQQLTGITCGIKWVNDLFLDGRKVCGILAEAMDDGIILGIGVNLNPSALPKELESTVGFLNCGDIRAALAAEITNRMFRQREKSDYMQVYRSRSVLLGEKLRCCIGSREFTALAAEIDDDGGLVVIGPEGRETLHFGEVFLARM